MIKQFIEWLLSFFRKKEAPSTTSTMPPIATEKPADAFISDLGSRVAATMRRRSYIIDSKPGEINIVYIEDYSGRTPNKFDDLRLVFTMVDGQAKVLGQWQATTEPGRKYTLTPLKPTGAARIALGQQRAWQVGIHSGNHEALIQTGGEVTVYRDLNKDYEREGDRTDTGWFGINQHWGYDNTDIDGASAGCIVGRTKVGHKEFMAVVKSDPRYKVNPLYIFRTTILKKGDLEMK